MIEDNELREIAALAARAIANWKTLDEGRLHNSESGINDVVRCRNISGNVWYEIRIVDATMREAISLKPFVSDYMVRQKLAYKIMVRVDVDDGYCDDRLFESRPAIISGRTTIVR